MFEHRREGLVPVDDHLDRIDRTVELAEVALHAIFGIGDDRTLCVVVPTEYVYEAGLVADAAPVAGVQIYRNGVHWLSGLLEGTRVGLLTNDS
jgi:hypothetical protein